MIYTITDDKRRVWLEVYDGHVFIHSGEGWNALVIRLTRAELDRIAELVRGEGGPGLPAS